MDIDTGENKGDCCYNNQYNNGTNCNSCPEGADCSVVGTTLATLSMTPGYWRASQATTDVRDCWLAEACGNVTKNDTAPARRTTDTTASVVQANNDNKYCTDGYKGPCKYMDILTQLMFASTLTVMYMLCHCMYHTPTDCAVCASGYSKSIGYECSECKSGTKAGIFTALALVLVVFVLLLIYLAIELLGLGDSEDAISNFTTFGCMKKLAALPWDKLRIPIVAFQILTQFISITGLPLPDIYRKFLAWTDVFNLNLGWLLSLGCLARIDFYQKLLITTLGPFAAVAVLACTYTIVRRSNTVQAVTAYSSQRVVVPARTARLEKALAKHYLVCLAMTFLVYSTVSTTVFQTFACDVVNDNDPLKPQYLRADYSVECGTSEHKLYKAYAAFMVIIYPLGIPALYGYLLWSNKHKLSSKNDASVRMLNRHRDVSLRPTRFLWKPYSSRMYYWEVIECMRRLLLTGAVVFIAPGTPAQAAVACILAVVSAIVAVYLRPHADTLDGKIYTVGAMIIFLSMFLS
jgi:hypothetical protein